jgi:quercetin dioxygenase-like cupin family protein
MRGGMSHDRLIALVMIAVVAAVSAPARAAEPTPSSEVKIVTIQALPNAPGQTLTAMTVDVPPGGVSPPHHHAGFVFVYVLAGTVESQLNQQAPRRFVAGETWVEPPGTVHTRFANPSRTDTARILAVFVAPEGAALTTPNGPTNDEDED